MMIMMVMMINRGFWLHKLEEEEEMCGLVPVLPTFLGQGGSFFGWRGRNSGFPPPPPLSSLPKFVCDPSQWLTL